MQQLTGAYGVMGVYAIVHRATGRFYIGSSADVGQRCCHHRSRLRRGLHGNPRLQAAWHEHGAEAFTFVLVERVVDLAQLRPREQAWLNESRCWDLSVGFNRSPSTNGVGWRFTPEQCAALSARLRGLPKSAEHRAAMSARPVTPEQREKGRQLGLAGRGVPKSPEHRRKIGRRGSANHAAKLTESDVAAIKRRLAAGEKGRHLAAEFGVHESIVSEIKHGRRWRHVPPQE